MAQWLSVLGTKRRNAGAHKRPTPATRRPASAGGRATTGGSGAANGRAGRLVDAVDAKRGAPPVAVRRLLAAADLLAVVDRGAAGFVGAGEGPRVERDGGGVGGRGGGGGGGGRGDAGRDGSGGGRGGAPAGGSGNPPPCPRP